MNEDISGINITFQTYLLEHRLKPLEVAFLSGVRYLIVWKIMRNKPVTDEQAVQVRAGLQKMTGMRYWGSIKTFPKQAKDFCSCLLAKTEDAGALPMHVSSAWQPLHQPKTGKARGNHPVIRVAQARRALGRAVDL